MTQPLVSVVIPTLNAGAGFTMLLESIRSQQFTGGIEIVVIDSGSKDGTLDMAREADAITLTVSPGGFNHGRARNQAIAKARGEFIILTVQDALPADDFWIDKLLAPLREDSGLAGSYGLQQAPLDASLLSRARSSVWFKANHLPLVKSVASDETFWQLPPAQRLALVSFDDVSSCIRRSVWEKYPLPELSYGEDIAWAMRVLLEGYGITYLPDARVWHAHERGAWYELRRSCVDGYMRHRLLRWPVFSLSPREAMALLYEAARPQLIRKYGSLVDSRRISEILAAELQSEEVCERFNFVRVYNEILAFTWNLMEEVPALIAGPMLPDGLWEDLYHFATAAVIGGKLGVVTAARQSGPAFLDRVFWRALKLLLDGV